MADQALRVLAAASRSWDGSCRRTTSPEHLEQELCFIGLAGMIDPVRPEVKAAIAGVPSGGHPPGDDHRRPQGHRRGHRQASWAFSTDAEPGHHRQRS